MRPLDLVATRIATAMQLQTTTPRLAVDLDRYRHWLYYYHWYQAQSPHVPTHNRTGRAVVAAPLISEHIKLELERRLAFAVWSRGDLLAAIAELNALPGRQV